MGGITNEDEGISSGDLAWVFYLQHCYCVIATADKTAKIQLLNRLKNLVCNFRKKTPDTLIQPSVAPSQAATGQAVAVQSKKPVRTKTPDSTAAQKATKEPKETQKPSEKTRSFTVRSGLLSSSVSRELKEAGFY